jgi:electron transfer flavoprotein alpha subunit
MGLAGSERWAPTAAGYRRGDEDMPGVLVYSERDAVANELLSGACQMGLGPVFVAVLGPNAATRAAGFFRFGASLAYVPELATPSGLDVGALTSFLEECIRTSDASTVLLGSTRRGKELAGRLAQRLGAGCITDAIALRRSAEGLLADRFALGGNTVATERVLTGTQVISVMPKVFEALPAGAQTGRVTSLAWEAPEQRVVVVERRAKSTDAVNLEDAGIIVGAGKGLERKEDLAIVEGLARVLHGEVGCTRALAADYQWLPEDRLIGLSGRKCKPRLYVAVGISGQIQHTVGISGARTIVAINKDKDAPIFKMADYGLLGDLYDVLPELTRRLSPGSGAVSGQAAKVA